MHLLHQVTKDYNKNKIKINYIILIIAGLLSREAARIAEDFTLSVGVGDDMVMHMTIDNVEDLRTNMLQVLQSCRLPKVISFYCEIEIVFQFILINLINLYSIEYF